MLDRLPPVASHLVLMLAAALLSWLGQDVIPALSGQPGWGALAGSLAALLVAWATPLTRQYGMGSPSDGPAR